MKNLSLFTSAALLFALAFFFAHIPAFSQSLKGNGNLKAQNRTVFGFKGIDVGGGFIVEISQGNKESLRLEADENLLSNIKTEVKDGVLHIYNEKSLTTTKSMKAYITVKELNKVDISGGVKVTGNSTFKADVFDLDMSGGSKVKLALQTKKLDADMSGGSHVELTGRAGAISINMSGGSKVEAAALEAKVAKINASGASKIKVYATETLDINASGASAIAYKGSPRITSDVSAAAKISKL